MTLEERLAEAREKLLAAEREYAKVRYQPCGSLTALVRSDEALRKYEVAQREYITVANEYNIREKREGRA